MCTEVTGPIVPTGIKWEKYLITFRDVGYRFSIEITIQTRAHVLKAVTAALTYAKHDNVKYPDIIHSDNAKGYLAHATVGAAINVGTMMRTKIP